MPKYIKKRKRGERIEHQFLYGNKYKTCSICNEWKLLDQFGTRQASWDKKNHCCKACVKKKNKQRRKVMKEKREKEREMAPPGFSVCLYHSCTVKELLQPLDQFISPFVRNNEPMDTCQTCRNKSKEDKEQRYAACEKVWDDWRREHPCVKCINDPNYKHNYLLIEADHLPEFEKVENCSNHSYWSAESRGPRLQKAEVMKCQATCKFHHRLVTQQRDRDNGRILKQPCRLRKREIMNAEKHKRGCCNLCKRVVKEGEECAFDFDHRDPNTKFKYKGETKSPSKFANLSDALFDKQWPLEQAKCDLLCANCHTLKSKVNKDGYK